jgi:hypothetical protein
LVSLIGCARTYSWYRQFCDTARLCLVAWYCRMNGEREVPDCFSARVAPPVARTAAAERAAAGQAAAAPGTCANRGARVAAFGAESLFRFHLKDLYGHFTPLSETFRGTATSIR